MAEGAQYTALYVDTERLKTFADALMADAKAMRNVLRLIDNSFDELDASWVGQDREDFEQDHEGMRRSGRFDIDYSGLINAIKAYEETESEVAGLIG